MEREIATERRAQIERLCGVSLRVEICETELKIKQAGNPESDCSSRNDLLKLTSGTTSAPRAVRFRAAQLLADCDNVCRTMGLREDDLSYGIVSFAHSYGFSNLITPLLCRGVPLVAADDIYAAGCRRWVEAEFATVLPECPRFFEAWRNFQPGKYLRLCHLRGCFAGKRGREIFHPLAAQDTLLYGASECGGICYRPASDELDPQPGYVGPALEGST
jgi:acyl-coenzyme A synthetase/AMP-(fatty) acid ligase